jgi:pimeloyl-ACP methyl ester carboxylesterase
MAACSLPLPLRAIVASRLAVSMAGQSLSELPPLRSAQEQFAAMFGESDPAALTTILSARAFDEKRAPLVCPTLVLEGGVDPLVPLGAQRGFLVGNHDPLSRVETWPDGEHTIYNHPHEHNARATAWFSEALALSAR